MRTMPRQGDFICWYLAGRFSVWSRNGGHEMTVAYGDADGREVCRWVVPGTIGSIAYAWGVVS